MLPQVVMLYNNKAKKHQLLTMVLTAVARFELTPSIPIFAKIEVNAAKIADKIAKIVHI